MKIRILITCFFYILSREAQADQSTGIPLERTVTIDAILSTYIDKGCSIQATILNHNGTLTLTGPFLIKKPDNTPVVEGKMSNGRIHGDLKFLGREKKLLSLARYINGVITGERIEWNPQGQVISIAQYDSDGKKNGVERYFSNGMVSIEIKWKAGNPLSVLLYDNQNQITKELNGQAMHDWFRIQMESQMGTDN